MNDKTIQSENRHVAQNIIEFSGRDVGEIATHRTDLTVLQIDATMEEVFAAVQETEFTRIPVYDEDIDQIAGILHVKDFFRSLKSVDLLLSFLFIILFALLYMSE